MRDDDDTLAHLTASPLNPLPGAVWVLLLAVLGVEAVLSAASVGLLGGAMGVGWRLAAIEDYAFASALQAWMLDSGVYPLRHLLRYVSFSFVHGGVLHAVFSCVLLAALGKMLAERFGAAAFLALALLAPALGAAVFGLVVGNDPAGWLIGATPMAFALVGGFTWVRWHAARSPTERRRAFGLIGALLLARMGFGLLAETGPGWVADVSAFMAGFGLSALVLGPGSWARVRARLRG